MTTQTFGAVACVIPAFEAQRTIAHVVRSVIALWPDQPGPRVIVVDDGSRDATGELARRAGALVVSHDRNLGKGAALRSGFERAQREGACAAVTMDADGQHFAADALRLALHPAPPETLLLGVRDLQRAGAPAANRFSNALSNFFLSRFSGQQLRDTQCGLRRYPIAETLASPARAPGFAFESELVLFAALASWPIEQLPVEVHYPPGAQRTSHFHNVADPARIVVTVVRTIVRHWTTPRTPRRLEP